MTPNSGPRNISRKTAGAHACIAKVTSFLQWTQWLFSHVHSARAPIVLNLDETAIAQAVPKKRGYVIGPPSRVTKCRESFTTRQTHGHCTMVGLIAADPSLQVHCKQLLLCKDGNLDSVTKAALAAVGPPLEWLRGTAGWTNGEHMCSVLTAIRRPFLAAFPNRHIILFMDSASQHVSHRVLAHANRLRMQIVLIPASLTWLLQPLDTHVFSLLKRKMVSLQQAVRAADPHGRLHQTAWVDILQEAVRDVISSRDWSAAFAGNGLLGITSRIRSAVLGELGACLPLPLQAPTDEQLCWILGRHRVQLSIALHSEARRVLRLNRLLAAEAAAHVSASDGAAPPVVVGMAPASSSGAGSASSSAAPSAAGALPGGALRLPRGRRLSNPSLP